MGRLEILRELDWGAQAYLAFKKGIARLYG